MTYLGMFVTFVLAYIIANLLWYAIEIQIVKWRLNSMYKKLNAVQNDMSFDNNPHRFH